MSRTFFCKQKDWKTPCLLHYNSNTCKEGKTAGLEKCSQDFKTYKIPT